MLNLSLPSLLLVFLSLVGVLYCMAMTQCDQGEINNNIIRTLQLVTALYWQIYKSTSTRHALKAREREVQH